MVANIFRKLLRTTVTWLVHAKSDTLLITTVLAMRSCLFADFTVLAFRACVRQILPVFQATQVEFLWNKKNAEFAQFSLSEIK